MKIKQLIIALLLLVPTLLVAQPKNSDHKPAAPRTANALVEQYSSRKDVEYVKANKAILWMVKASAPKGSMEGVKELEILNFKGGDKTQAYREFRRDAEALFTSLRAECLSKEQTNKGLTEVYAERKRPITQYMMFVHDDKGDIIFMLMQGEKLPEPKK
ncbi:MAG: DUF4252 domain-containing protein [Rikenellaceae bacterium]